MDSIKKVNKKVLESSSKENKNPVHGVDEERWKVYHAFVEILAAKSDIEIKKILNEFTENDFMAMPIVLDLVSYKKNDLLKWLYEKNMPLTYQEWDGGNALHVACGAGGSLECVKFLIENNIQNDINKESTKFGDTPLTLALSYGHRDIVDYFSKKFAVDSVSLRHLYVIIDRVIANRDRS